jgi:hypothetical protein
MSPRVITVTTHLSAHPPDHERLRIALEKLITAIYGQSSTLNVIIGHTDENPNENMLNIKAPVSPATMHALEAALKQLFGLNFAIGYSGGTSPLHNSHNVAVRIREAVKEITESFKELDEAEQ